MISIEKYNAALLKEFFLNICREFGARYFLTVGFYPPNGVCRDDLDLSKYMKYSRSDMYLFNKNLSFCLKRILVGRYKESFNPFNIVSVVEDRSKFGGESVMPHLHAAINSHVSADEFALKIKELICVRFAKKYGVPFYYDIQNVSASGDELYSYLFKNIDLHANLDCVHIFSNAVAGHARGVCH